MAQLVLRAAGEEVLVALLRERSQALGRPCVVALDGRSGCGKSTLAARLATALDAAVLEGDDFFAGGVTVRTDAPQDRARDCIDWRRQRPVLQALRAGRDATYIAFDWHTFDGRCESAPRCVAARPIVLFEGVYSARPELGDSLDLRVLLSVPEETRSARLLEREGSIGPWERQWQEAEDWYFAHAAPPATFDVIVQE
jgi:uridine kinase